MLIHKDHWSLESMLTAYAAGM